ncbi:hypothetical protein BHE97_13640 [Aeromicrobium sp. PE09-221]|nr:hypothetical protein BHE97_13640 [Aeromicrobium sp. PE09-221]
MQKAVAQGGLTLVIEGLAGMGKTFLLREIGAAARESSTWAASFVNADEIEQGESYSFIERLAASGLFGDWDFEPDHTTQPIPVARECLRRVRESELDGAVVLIDDAQWVDKESQRVLRYVVPRIRRRHVLLACAVRTPHEEDSFGKVLTELVADNSYDLVQLLAPLTVDQIRAFAADRLGTGVSVRTGERLLKATSGSFLRLDAILNQLTPDEVSRMHLTWDLPIRAVHEGENPLLHAFRALSAPARATTEIVCLGGHEMSRADLAAVAALLGEEIELAEPSAAGVLSESGFGATVIPRHALVAQAIRETIEADRIRSVSRALSTITSGYRSVRHALGGSAEWTDELDKQVRYYVAEALDRGSFDNASDVLRTVLSLVSDLPARQELLTSLALVHIRAKTGYLILDLAEEYETLPDSALREFILIVLAAHQVGQEFPRNRVMELLARPAENPDDRVISAFLSFFVVIMAMRTEDPSVVPFLIDHARKLFEQCPSDPSELSDARLGWMVAPGEYLVLLDAYRVVHDQRMLAFEEMAAALPELHQRIEALPDGPMKVDALVAVAGAELALGHFEDGLRLARWSVKLLDRVAEPWAAGTTRLILADCLVIRGDYAEASALIDLSEEVAFDVLDVETRPAFAALRGFIAAVRGNGDPGRHLEQARLQYQIAWEAYGADLAVLAECEAARAAGDAEAVLAASSGPFVDRLNNTRRGFLTYRANALIELGELDEAAALIEDLDQWHGVRWQEYWGSLAWLRARLAHARGDSTIARRQYDVAVAAGGMALPRALTLADFGSFLIEQGATEDGRRALTQAVTLLEGIGAGAYLARIRCELDSSEDNPRHPGAHLLASLTERERQIVDQLADGRSNNQIAESMVISVATVRSHVSNVLRKLRLTSRGEVARLLREAEPSD